MKTEAEGAIFKLPGLSHYCVGTYFVIVSIGMLRKRTCTYKPKDDFQQ